MSESESDTDHRGAAHSSAAAPGTAVGTPTATTSKRDELNIRIASLQQENRVLKVGVTLVFELLEKT